MKKYFWGLVLLFQACVASRSIDIQYYDKSPQCLPKVSGNILLVTNLYNRDLASRKAMMDWALDSVAATEATLAFAQMLEASPQYEGISPVGTVYFRTDTSKVILPLSWAEVNQMALANGAADVVVSLDYIHVSPYYDCSQRFIDNLVEYQGYLDMSVYCYWRVYDRRNSRVSNTFLHRDTLSWEATDWVEVKTGNQLPGFFAAAAYAGASVAEEFAKQVAPVWISDTRTIFDRGNSAMEQAAEYAQSGAWLDAAAIWQRLASAKDASTAAKASYNMAVANEMLGNFELALEWLSKAQKLSPELRDIDHYRGIIESRVEANK